MLSPVSELSWPKKQLRRKIYALPAGFSGCAFWRYRIPFAALKKSGCSFDINIADNPNKLIRMQDVQEHVKNSDLISIQAPGYKDACTLMSLYKSEGKKVVIDYDDYSFDLSPGNPRYSELGTKECEVVGENGAVFRWRDGENGFDLRANQDKFEAFKLCVEKADLITTTTEYLADKFRKHNPNVAICPNSIDFDMWKPLPRNRQDVSKSLTNAPGEVRIGWFGGDSHYVDLKVFKGLLPELCRKYPQVKIVMQGPLVSEWREFFKDIPPERLEWYGWTDLRYYTYFLASRNWDIGLCPLEDNDFNRCKSNIKALEFMSLGAAVVAQNIPPYGNTLAHDVTGFLANTEQEWLDNVSKLIENPALRNTIAMAGYYWAKENFDIKTNCRIWEKAYLDLMES